jgi:hypothetical protein
MQSLFMRAAGIALFVGAIAPATAVAQTSVTVSRTGGNMLPTRFSVELRDAAGNASGLAVLDHPGMGVKAVSGVVPAAQLAALEQAEIAADLLNQPGDEWTGALPDVGTATYTDEQGDYSALHPMSGPNGVDVTPEMQALAQAMSDAQTAFVPGGTPAPTAAQPFLSYTYGGGWIGSITLDVATDGSYHLHGSNGSPKFNGIDKKGQLTKKQLASLKAYMKSHAATWASYPPMFGQMIPDGVYEIVTYTDSTGVAQSVERWGNARAKTAWTYLEKWFKLEADGIDPALKL